MDIKCKQLMSIIHRRIMERSFGEIDICSLLILIREYTYSNRDYSKTEWKGGYLREICDFNAHRKKNKGFAFENAKYSYNHSTCTGEFHEIETNRRVLTGMSEDIIIEELNNIFKEFEFFPIPKSCEVEIILCIISLLQFTLFETEDKKANGYLYVVIDSEGVYLCNYIYDAGVHPILLCVEDARYTNLVDSLLQLENECFYLERIGTELKIVLPTSKP